MNRRNSFEMQIHSIREEFLKESSEKGQRTVCAVQRYKATCLHPRNTIKERRCYITFWRPSGDIFSELKEGKCFTFFNLDAGKVLRNGLVCLSFNKSSTVKPFNEDVPRDRFTARSTYMVDDLRNLSSGEEFDSAGVMVAVSPIMQIYKADGRVVPRQTLIMCGIRGDMLAVDVDLQALASPSRVLDLHGPSVILARNLDRLSYSHGTGVFSCNACEFSELIIDPPSSDEMFSALKKWVGSEKNQVSQIRETARRLLNLKI